jgi:hypothetical protein
VGWASYVDLEFKLVEVLLCLFVLLFVIFHHLFPQIKLCLHPSYITTKDKLSGPLIELTRYVLSFHAEGLLLSSKLSSFAHLWREVTAFRDSSSTGQLLLGAEAVSLFFLLTVLNKEPAKVLHPKEKLLLLQGIDFSLELLLLLFEHFDLVLKVFYLSSIVIVDQLFQFTQLALILHP